MKMFPTFWIVLGALGATALLGQNVYAAGFQNMSHSGTANAMGSMGTANPDEPNASFYNPATVAMQENFKIYVGATFLIPKTSWVPLNGDQDRKVETEDRFFPPPNVHLGLPIDLGAAGRLGLGFGLNYPYGLGITWPDGWEGQASIISQDLQTLNFHPNLSYKLPNIDLSFGGGVQIYYTTVELQRDIVLRDDTAIRTQIGGDGVGVSATGALMYRPIKQLALGLSYRGGTEVDIEGRAHFAGEENTPFESSFVDQAGDTAIPYPHTFTLGVGAPLERLFLGLDVGYTTWSDYDRIDVEFSEPCRPGSATCTPTADRSDPPTTSIVSAWEDSVFFRFGAEYELREDFKVRVGAAYDLTPVPDATLSPSLPGNDRAVVSGGLGYTVAGVRADASYQLVRAVERVADKTTNLRGIYNTSAHVIGLNLGYGY